MPDPLHPLKPKSRTIVCSVLSGCLLAISAEASNLPQTALDPGQIEKRFSVHDPIQSRVGNSVFVPSVLPSEAPAAEGIVLPLKEIKIEGVTVYTPEQLAPYYVEYLNTNIPIKTLYEIAARITQRYHADGYALSQVVIPPQEIGNGVVQMVASEGYVTQVKIQNSDENLKESFADVSILKNTVKAITHHIPTNAQELESQMLKLNDLPGLNVRGVLEPLPAEKQIAGAVGMMLYTKPKDNVTSLVLDNQGSRYVGPYQLSANYTAYNVLQPLDSLTVGGYTSMQTKELKYGTLGYSIPLTLDTALTLVLGYNTSEPGAQLRANDILSTSKSFSIDVAHQWLRSRARNLSIGAELALKNIRSTVINTNLYDDRLRVLRLRSVYDAIDPWQGTNVARLVMSQGLDILDNRRSGSTNLSKAEGRTDFTKLEAELSHTQALDERYGFSASIAAQLASTPLLSSEEFGIGRQQFGRAYDPSEITGDHGVAARIELRRTDIKELTGWHLRPQPYVFVETGKVWNKDRGGEDPSIASVGAGVALYSRKNISLNLALAQPLTKTADNPSYGNGKNPKLLFSLQAQF